MFHFDLYLLITFSAFSTGFVQARAHDRALLAWVEDEQKKGLVIENVQNALVFSHCITKRSGPLQSLGE